MADPPPFPFKAIEYPPMPVTDAEWRVHWAFYQATLTQRDQAWAEVKELRQLLERLGHLLHFTEEVQSED